MKIIDRINAILEEDPDKVSYSFEYFPPKTEAGKKFD
jgi:5,10-methylenetetrahydrofolate reductase